MALEKRLDITKKFNNNYWTQSVKLFVDNWGEEDLLNLIVVNYDKEEGVSISLTEDQVKDFIEILQLFIKNKEEENV